MKEETQAILFGLGMIIFITSAFIILKKFFNMTTSGAIAFIIIAIGTSSLVALLVIEYFGYRARKKTKRS